jgi:thiamine biosynthesis protein ThiI
MKLVSLISGGIDSPVATHMMIERGAEIIAIHFDNRPFTDDGQFEKTRALVNHVEKTNNVTIKTWVVPHKESHVTFAKHCKRNLHCVLCRRMMLRVSEQVAEREGADALLTGESLGQVASQTLRNIRTESQAVSIPILRPLIGLDKLEIEEIAKRIGTYEISILPGMCCSIVPKKPSTYSRLDTVLEEEGNVDIDSLVADALKGMHKL